MMTWKEVLGSIQKENKDILRCIKTVESEFKINYIDQDKSTSDELKKFLEEYENNLEKTIIKGEDFQRTQTILEEMINKG